MQVKIFSDKLNVTVDSFGAELHSIRNSDGREYLWQADENVWKRHAPVLFPFICNTASKKYTVNGEEYALANHGFARDSEFSLVSASDSSAEFTLGYTVESLKLYPFRFALNIKYELDGNMLKVSCTAENKDDKIMPFFIGGHPAFRCPLAEGEKFSDYTVVYEKPETILQDRADGSKAVILDNTDRVSVSHELFANDVFLQNKPNSKWVALEGKSGSVKLHYDNSGCIAVWSSWFSNAEKTEAAEFVCLEPWCSAPVYCEGTEELTEMPNAVKLSSGEKYTFSYTIEIN
ncbi:MAG: aldose 1-epimerase family protein [Oscillospiraceae bacterium]|nr:aldose 1-epimerase family protein [Oscillospiraceae bacterium]